MKNKSVLWLLVIFVLIATPLSYASGNNNSGGEGRSNAFDFVEAIPGNAAKDVKLDEEIKLLFNKNVVNFTVKDNNSQCFTMKDSNNKEIPIEVIFADDQIEPEKKREIILKPKSPLAEDTRYSIHILPQLQAKNGSSLDKNVAISFTTLSTQDPKSPSKEKSDIKEDEKPTNRTPVQNQDRENINQNINQDDSNINSIGERKEKEILEKGDKDLKEDATLDSMQPDTKDDKDIKKAKEDKEDKNVESGKSDTLNDIEDDTEVLEDSAKTSKTYIGIVVLGVALGLIFTFRKKL